MKKYILAIFIILQCFSFCGCGPKETPAEIAATTLPVHNLTEYLCQGTPLRVTRLITENVSCLHDYSLQVSQMQAIEGAQVIVISGAGLEDFLADVLTSAAKVIDASEGVDLICNDNADHSHDHEHAHNHSHMGDPHIWLSPENAKKMSQSICAGLCDTYPEYAGTFRNNLTNLLGELDILNEYAQQSLSTLSCRELITFHDGFSYLAQAFDLHILKAIEEESGSEPSAQEIISLVRMVEDHSLRAIFTETHGSSAAASIIAAETGCNSYTLDMAMSGDSYFDAMYKNIDTLKEALE